MGILIEDSSRWLRNKKSGTELAEFWFIKGLQCGEKGDLAGELQCYQLSLEAAELPGCVVNVGTIYFHLGDFQEAKKYYERAIALEPNYALAHYNLGTLFEELNDVIKAADCYEQTIKLDPNYRDAYVNLGLIQKDSRNYFGALRSFAMASRLSTNEAEKARYARDEAGLREKLSQTLKTWEE